MLFRSKGVAGSEGTLKMPAVRADKRLAYEAAVKAAMNEPKDGATTMKKRAAEKLAAKAPESSSTESAPEAVATEVETAVVESAPETVTTEAAPNDSAAEEGSANA